MMSGWPGGMRGPPIRDRRGVSASRGEKGLEIGCVLPRGLPAGCRQRGARFRCSAHPAGPDVLGFLDSLLLSCFLPFRLVCLVILVCGLVCGLVFGLSLVSVWSLGLVSGLVFCCNVPLLPYVHVA